MRDKFVVSLSQIRIWLISSIIIIMSIPSFDRALSVTTTLLIILLMIMNANCILSKKYVVSFLVVSIILIWELLWLFLGISNTTIGYIFKVAKFYLCYFSYIPVAHRFSRRDKLFILKIVMCSVVFTILHNILLLFQLGDEYYTFQNSEVLMSSNIAETFYGCAVVLLMGSVYIILKSNISKKWRIKCIFVMICCAIYIFGVAVRVTNIILAMAMLLMLWILNRKNKMLIFIISIVAFLVLIVLYNTGYYVDLLRLISKILNNESVDARINSIIFVLEGGSFIMSGSSLSGRYNLTMTSWKTWTASFENVMFGIGDQREQTDLIGNHCYVLDTLARFGILYAILVIVFFKQAISRVLDNVQKHSLFYAETVTLLCFFLMRNIIGVSFCGVIAIQLFITLPIVKELFVYKEGE